MSCQEFCTQVAPMIKELEEECRKMTLKDFQKYRHDFMEALTARPEICKDFTTAVLDLIQKKIFREEVANRTS